MLRGFQMTLSEDRMAELRSLAGPHLEPGEQVLSGALGQVVPSAWVILLGVILYAMLIKSWQLVFTDQRLLAIRVGSLRWRSLQTTGETLSFPWSEMVSVRLERKQLADALSFSTSRDKVTYQNLRKCNIEALRAALRSVRPDLFPA